MAIKVGTRVRFKKGLSAGFLQPDQCEDISGFNYFSHVDIAAGSIGEVLEELSRNTVLVEVSLALAQITEDGSISLSNNGSRLALHVTVKKNILKELK